MSNRRAEFRLEIDRWLDDKIDEFHASVPMARHQRDDIEIDLRYLIRHGCETIRRIRLKREVDARIVLHFAKHSPAAAKLWAEYTEDEMLHDRFFLGDLQRLGVSPDEVYGCAPLFATQLLQGYFYYTLEHEGPMASLASAYFLEYTTRKTQPAWLDNLAQRLGPDKVKGARAHLAHDEGSEHTDFVWRVLAGLVATPADEQRLRAHLERIYGLFCAYFVELAQEFGRERVRHPCNPSKAVARAAVEHRSS